MNNENEQEAADNSGLTRWAPLVVVLAVVGGFVMLSWYAYHAGIRSVKEEDLLVIEADKAPLKEKPTDPGGMQVPHQDKTVYSMIEDKKQPAKVERVLPAPEEPMPKDKQKQASDDSTEASGPSTWVNRDLQKAGSREPVKDPKKMLEKSKIPAAVAGPDEKTVYTIKDSAEHQVIAAQSATEEDQSVSFVASKKGAAPVQAVEKIIQGPEKQAKPFAPEKITEKAAEKAAEKPADTAKSALKPVRENVFARNEPAAQPKAPEPEEAEASATEPPVQEKPAAKPVEKVAEKSREAVSETPKPEERKAPVAANGSGVVQLGAYRSEDEAQENWDKMHIRFKELSDKKSAIARADLGAKGIYYRLRVVGLPSAADAKTLCKALSGKGQACIIPVGQ